jgi:hypothetical protein
MEGVWKGTGWVVSAGKKQFFKETETVTNKLNGTVIQLEAFGVDTNDSSKIINNALGILMHNNEKKKSELHIFQSDGSFVIASVKANSKNEMEWSLTVSSTLKIKYVIKVEGSTWYEAGYSCTDGIFWQQNFEMSLSKIK